MGWFNHQLATNNFTIVRNFKFQIIIVFRVHVCQPAWVNGSWSHQITFIFMASQPTFPLRNKALIRAYYPIRPYQNLKSHYFWGGRLTSHNIWTSLHKKWLCSGNPLIAFYWKVMRVGDRNISVDSSLLPLMFCCDLAMKEVFSMAPFFVEDDLTDHLPLHQKAGHKWWRCKGCLRFVFFWPEYSGYFGGFSQVAEQILYNISLPDSV